MKVFFRRPVTKWTVVALLIASVVLLCPVNSASSTAMSCDAGVVPMSDHNTNAGGAGSDCSKAHTEVGNHVASLLTVFNDLGVLFFAAITILALFFHRALLLVNKLYLTKLKYFRHRHRVIIKPKLETAFLRWLNLLGGTVAFSF